MSTAETSAQALIERPKRADARRNYEKVLAAAREAFAEGGESTALEEIARRAGVGIGTLYRHFPNRQALLEALYVDEVEEVCRSAAALEGADPWEALSGWFERFIAYMGTKRALAARAPQLPRPGRPSLPGLPHLDVRGRRTALETRPGGRRGAPRRQHRRGHPDGGRDRQDPGERPAQTEHIVRVALDGLRYHPES